MFKKLKSKILHWLRLRLLGYLPLPELSIEVRKFDVIEVKGVFDIPDGLRMSEIDME